MYAEYLKEITHKGGIRALIYGPGRAADIKNPRGSSLAYRASDRVHLTVFRNGQRTISLNYMVPAARADEIIYINWSTITSITNVKKNDLPLYINWGWKSELFETLLKGV